MRETAGQKLKRELWCSAWGTRPGRGDEYLSPMDKAIRSLRKSGDLDESRLKDPNYLEDLAYQLVCLMVTPEQFWEPNGKGERS